MESPEIRVQNREKDAADHTSPWTPRCSHDERTRLDRQAHCYPPTMELPGWYVT